MDERQKRLFIWSVIVGFLGWLGWELEIEKRKAIKQIEEHQKRNAIQNKYRE